MQLRPPLRVPRGAAPPEPRRAGEGGDGDERAGDNRERDRRAAEALAGSPAEEARLREERLRARRGRRARDDVGGVGEQAVLDARLPDSHGRRLRGKAAAVVVDVAAQGG